MLDNSSKKKFFHDMQRIRMIEEAIANRYVEQQMRCPVHLSIGQESVAVGVCQALQQEDYVMSSHRSHAHYLAKGGDLKSMLAEIYGKETGCTSGIGGSMHLIDLSVNMLGSTPIVGSSMPVAVGTAFGTWLKNEKRVTAIFFGEGTTEEGVFMECLNFAALKKLPVIFVCENNLYSVYSSMDVRQSTGRSRVAIARAHGIEAFEGEGNRIELVFEEARKAVDRAREGLGPTFFEFFTYRWREHCGPNYDNHIGYRTEEEYLNWRSQCPIEDYERKLIAQKVISQEDIIKIRQDIAREIDEAFRFAETSAWPDKSKMGVSVYAKSV